MIVTACSVPEELVQESNTKPKEDLKRLYYVPKVMLAVRKGRVQFN